uniref:Uncharacterized protein n=1 Tax=Anguilla anguilla TaxID=7936 RepID=A0A0E9QS94_ANGAN
MASMGSGSLSTSLFLFVISAAFLLKGKIEILLYNTSEFRLFFVGYLWPINRIRSGGLKLDALASADAIEPNKLT